MAMSHRDYTILLQNLTNRATDIEISDAGVEKRKVSVENIKHNLTLLKTLIKEDLGAFMEANPEEEEKKSSYKPNYGKGKFPYKKD